MGKVPTFPDSKHLHLSDKHAVEEFTREFDPYSDFNFTSMFCYDTDGTAEISQLNGNLVLKFEDYITLDPFYTFLGRNEPATTITSLLDYSERIGIQPELKMVPQDVITALGQTHQFAILEDRDNDDYIIPAGKFGNMEGGEYHKKRNMVSRFYREYGERYRLVFLNPHDLKTQQQMLKLFDVWVHVLGKDVEDSAHELHAITRLFGALDDLDVLTFGVEIDGNLCAFLVAEVLWRGYAIRHFEKLDVRYHGITEFLQKESACFFSQKGIEFINYEQDLGIEGLRNAKMLCQPSHFLKKYIIRPTSG